MFIKSNVKKEAKKFSWNAKSEENHMPRRRCKYLMTWYLGLNHSLSIQFLTHDFKMPG